MSLRDQSRWETQDFPTLKPTKPASAFSPSPRPPKRKQEQSTPRSSRRSSSPRSQPQKAAVVSLNWPPPPRRKPSCQMQPRRSPLRGSWIAQPQRAAPVWSYWQAAPKRKPERTQPKPSHPPVWQAGQLQHHGRGLCNWRQMIKAFSEQIRHAPSLLQI